ncbi:S-layer homology domain-containing protein [Paenibacillus sedimenti]|uniref:S-layer homology domain-containing protein n=1 Tax=Paenibacillus sedimenti TaxID=2770274 RepID=A0A926KJ20_9BACL|nr:S-layer homology domain-containing protein [Paenibacillus sedimenti]MBD0378510.1 S-layer homology domain-containing protein [Paenibacillus sedimenti]
MSKSLKVITSLVLAFSLTTSVAIAAEVQQAIPATAVKTTADFKDLANVDADLKAKIDALLAQGYMDGKGENFDASGSMTRAEAAKLVAKVFKLTIDEKATSSFTDVDGTDESINWAIPFIEAAKAKGIIDGLTDSTFAPKAEVTIGHLAALFVKGLGKASEVKSTNPWYNGYLDVAKANGVELGIDGAKVATRADLVNGAYLADQVFSNANKPAKVSVKEAKQIGAKTVSVVFDRDVDTAKATLALTRGTSSIASSVKWSDDKKSATLTLTDLKIVESDYSVSLGGLEASEIDKASASFKGQAEKVTKIDFVSAGDTIAKSPKVRVEVKPTNQFGETATFSSGNYTVFATTTNSPTLLKTEDGKLFIQLNTTDAGLISNNSQISVNIYDNDQHITATKNFKVGDRPFLTKVELGAVTYKSGKTALNLTGETALIPLTQYDQYGAVITKDSGALITPMVSLTPFEQKLSAQIVDENSDGVDDVVVKVASKVETSGEYTVSVFGGGSTATAKLAVKSTAIANKVELTQPSDTWASGDNNKYIEIIAYDAEGNKLSADDIAQNAKDGKFTISITGNLITGPSTDVPAIMLDSKGLIVTEGSNKGKLYVKKVEGKGHANVFIALFGIGVNSQSQINIPLVAARYPAGLKVATDVAAKAVDTATVNGKIHLVDQYGDKITGFSTNHSGATIDLVENGRSVTYDVYATVTPSSDYVGTYSGDLTLAPGSQVLTIGQFSDKEFKFTPTASAKNSSLSVKFNLRKRDFAGGVVGTVIDDAVGSITKKFTVIDPANVKLTYSLNGARDLFSTLDDGVTKNIAAAQPVDSSNKMAVELSLSAKDESAAEVKIPNTITTVVSDTYSTARVNAINGKAYVLGNKAGKTNITAIYTNAKGESGFVSTAITVKSDPIAIQSITSSASKTFARSTVYDIDGTTVKVQGADGALAWQLMGDVTLKDQYGNEYKNANIAAYKEIAPVIYIVNDVSQGLTVNLSLSSEGLNNQVNVSYGPGITGGSFTMTAISSSGKTTTTRVILNN